LRNKKIINMAKPASSGVSIFPTAACMVAQFLFNMT
jgi:hypothetical protein